MSNSMLVTGKNTFEKHRKTLMSFCSNFINKTFIWSKTQRICKFKEINNDMFHYKMILTSKYTNTGPHSKLFLAQMTRA